MSLPPGTRLGSHEIVGLLGAGGMGEVYRAHDTNLGRDVALKLLPPSFAHDAERVARFRREAHVLATLNHPNIAGIYGFEEADDHRFLVLELVEGPTLTDRIKSGPLALDEAIGIAREIAGALQAAHEKGIIHRDLKPANIALAADDTVKVLDFGLAKALEPASGPAGADPMNSPTITSPAMMTGLGVILGTAAYMSPEQAKGRPADKRSDVWAFGCVLFEMLTGSRAFLRETVTDTFAAVVGAEPDWALLPAETPASIRRLLARCLQKDVRRRLHDIADARIELEDAMSAPSVPVTAPASRKRARPILMALVLGMATAVVLLWALRDRFGTVAPSSPSDAHVVRLTDLPGLEECRSGRSSIPRCPPTVNGWPRH
jgi:serine/threonine protein kinase